jgi:hypothetical protein
MVMALAMLPPIAAVTQTRGESDPADLSGLEGSGIAAKLACVGCAGAILGVSGGSIGGFIVWGALYPEVYGACAYLCYDAFS